MVGSGVEGEVWLSRCHLGVFDVDGVCASDFVVGFPERCADGVLGGFTHSGRMYGDDGNLLEVIDSD